MRVILFILLIISFTVSAGSWKKYPYQAEGTDIVFPKDEGSHKPQIGLEWWYYVIHAKGMLSGDRYSILVSHFNNHIRFFSITNVDTGEHENSSELGWLSSKKKKLDLTHKTKHGKDTLKTVAPFEYSANVFGKEIELDANMISTKIPLMVTGTGYVPVGSSGHSWYYSNTRLNTEGTLKFKGITEPFIGEAWMDHQWGPFFVSPVEIKGVFETYEWFCLQLDDGTDIMISNIFDQDYKLPKKNGYGGIEYIDSFGNAEHVIDNEFVRTAFWQDPKSKHYMSMGWRVKVAKWDMDLTLEPDLKNQMVHVPFNGDFWEGSLKVTGTFKGKSVTGLGFGELIHRFEIPKVKFLGLKRSYDSKDLVNIAWGVSNPDEGNPLLFDLEILSNNSELASFSRRKSSVMKQMNFAPYKGKLIQLVLKAYSVDGTISRTIKSKPIKIK